MKLDVCSGNPADGENQASGFVKHDINLYPNIDIACDLRELDQYVKEKSVEYLRASHCLEHFSVSDVKLILKMFHKLIVDDGTLEIIVPNFKWHSQLCLSGNEEQAIYYCFGGQLDEYDLHKTAFTPNILRKRVEEAMFAILELKDESSITLIAKKI